MRLPLLLSVPHAGLVVPPEAQPYCVLSAKEVADDGDLGAAEIYDLASRVDRFVTADVARAIVDLNRAEDDRRKDGVVKTHTCWDVPVYEPFPPDETVAVLLEKYHRPYHRKLTDCSRTDVRLAVDCHTMAAVGPPVGPDPGAERPWVCLSHADGTCPADWMASLKTCFEEPFGAHVKVNDPFLGGYITRTHAAEMPWVQVELSRAPFMTNPEKRDGVYRALSTWCDRLGK